MRQVIALLLVLCFLPIALKADIAKCDKALGLCGALVEQQDASIKVLKTQVSTLEKRLEDDQVTSIIPVWLIFVIGVGAGGALGLAIHH